MMTAGFLVLKVIEKITLKIFKSKTEETKSTFDDFIVTVLDESIVPLLYFGIVYLGVHRLVLPSVVNQIFVIVAIVLLTFFGARFVIRLITHVLIENLTQKNSAVNKQALKVIVPAFKFIIWGIGLIFLLDNLGIKISAIVAGFGIGGIAVAMAAQAVLGDLLSFVAIVFDKPFVIGDFIIVDGYLGVVEHIGIKTTHVRSLGGELIVFGNSNLIGSRIRNYKHMEKRRVVFGFGVTYQTQHAQLKQIPDMVKNIIAQIKDTVYDRCHFQSFADSSLNFETVYYVLSGDYNKYMDIQQEINLGVKEQLEKAGIEFAYPTRTLYLSQNQDQKVAAS